MIAFLILVFTALNSPYLWPYPIFQFFCVGVGLAICLWLLIQRRPLPHSLLNLPLALLVLAAAVSVTLSSAGANRLFELLAYIVAFYFDLIYVQRDILVEQIQISGWVLAAAVLVARLAGVHLANGNVLASILLLHLPFGDELERRERWAWWGLMLAAMLATGSRGGFLGLAVAVAVLARLDWRKVGLVLFVMLPSLTLVDMKNSLIRLCYWRAALAAWWSAPLWGIGPGGLAQWIPPICGEPCPHAHNLALTVLAEMGVIGLAALLFLVWRIWQNRRPGPEWAALCGFAVMSLVDDPIWLYAPGLGVMSILAVIERRKRK